MKNEIRSTTLALAALLMTFVCFGCGSGGEGGSGAGSNASGNGQVAVSVTDAPGDFLKYEVKVVSVSLAKANGAQAETLPVSSFVDFAQLTDLTEFIRTSTVPNGRYVGVTLNLDYTGADIRVDDGTSAGGKQVGSVVDAAGNPVTTLSAKVDLDSSRPLVVAPGVTGHLTLDFNLAATNQVDMSQTAPVLTVQPALAADLSANVAKPHRVRGVLQAVAPAAGTFDLELRPFGAARNLGAFTVTTDENTSFRIDAQAPTKGAAGLTLLAAEPPLTAVTAIGDFDGTDGTFLAYKVLAGSAIEGGSLDLARGVVVMRSGNNLRIKGAALDREAGSLTLDEEFQVTIDPAHTRVTAQLDGTEALTTDDISVGQRVLVQGAVNGGDIDASGGLVRLLLTPISGVLTEKSAGQLVLNLQSMAGRRIDLFDFTGTGADPAAYPVATGALSLDAFRVGSPVRALGFVRPFGSPSPDFTAQTLVNLEGVPALLRINWRPSTRTSVSVVSATEISLSLSGAGDLHHVFRAGVGSELLPEPAPTLVAKESGTGTFSIRLDRGRGQSPVKVYGKFSDFSAALRTALEGGASVASVSASGPFSDADQTLAADSVFVQL